MKVINLLEDISIGKIPKKIKICNQEYEHDGIDYKRKCDDKYLFSAFLETTQHDLNMEVKIIEEPQEHKIPEKLDNRYYDKVNKCYSGFKELKQEELVYKINEILDYIKKEN